MSCGHSHMIPLPPVGDGSQTSRLADELAMAIHLGELKPGAPLREVEIAEGHGVSRTIVRASLQRLEAQGLAEIVLNKGARVRAADEQAVADMLELHVQLTTLAARCAAERADAQQVGVIAQFSHMLDHVAEDGGPAAEFQHLRIGFARYIVPSTLTDGLNILGSVPYPGYDATTNVIGDIQGVPQQRLSDPFPGGLVPVRGNAFGRYTNLAVDNWAVASLAD